MTPQSVTNCTPTLLSHRKLYSIIP